MTYFCPTLDPPLDGSCRKTTTHVRDYEHFIPTKFRTYPSIGPVRTADYVFSYILVHFIILYIFFIYCTLYILIHISALVHPFPSPKSIHKKIIIIILQHINLLYKHSPTYKHGNYTKINAGNALY